MPKNTELKVAVAYGGTSMKVQVKGAGKRALMCLLRRLGRLLDHAHVRTVDLRKVKLSGT